MKTQDKSSFKKNIKANAQLVSSNDISKGDLTTFAAQPVQHTLKQTWQKKEAQPSAQGNDNVPKNPWQPMQQKSAIKSNTKAPVQRLVYDPTKTELYTNIHWKDAKNADGIKIEAALNEPKNAFNETVKPRIAEPYDIDPYSVSFRHTPDAIATDFAEEQLKKKSLQMAILEEYNGNAQFLNKMSQASGKRRLSALKTLGFNKATFVDNVKVAFQKMVDQNHYLLSTDNVHLHGSEAGKVFKDIISYSKSILLPQEYLDEDSSSKVNFSLDSTTDLSNPQKAFVCSLISMVYQKASSVTTKTLAKEKMIQLLAKYGINLSPQQINANNLQAGKYLPNNTELYDTMVAGIHRVLQPAGTLYDLDRYSEQMLSNAGYTRIVSCNCNYSNLPANIPPHITLEAGNSYVFHIEGHAQAVLVKQSINGQIGVTSPTTLDKHGDYFTAFNETSKNYNLNWWEKNITAIWQD